MIFSFYHSSLDFINISFLFYSKHSIIPSLSSSSFPRIDPSLGSQKWTSYLCLLLLLFSSFFIQIFIFCINFLANNLITGQLTLFLTFTPYFRFSLISFCCSCSNYLLVPLTQPSLYQIIHHLLSFYYMF